MPFFDVLKPIFAFISQHWAMCCQRWEIKPSFLLNSITLWFQWTGLTWLAFLLSLLFVEVGEKNDLSLVDALLGGLLIGGGQWWVLRLYLRDAYHWIIVSSLSWGALAIFHIGVIGWMAPVTPHLGVRGIVGLFYGGYVGLGLGVGQWWILRRGIIQAWRWIPLQAGIWAVSIAFGWTLGGSLRSQSHLFVSEVVGLVLAWGAIAALSGIAIVGLLMTPITPVTPVTRSVSTTGAAEH